MSCSMSIKQKICKVKIFQLQSMLKVIRGLRTRNLEFRAWPWYSTWTILEQQSCTQKNQLQVAKYNESYTVFFSQLIRTYCLVVNVSCSESVSVGLIPARCWNSRCPLTILLGTEPVGALTHALYIAALSIFFPPWISSVEISRLQSCKL